MDKFRSESGFTIIEILVAITVLAVIAMMVTPTFRNQIAKMRQLDDMHKVEICFKESQLQAYTYRIPITVNLNPGSPGVLACGTSAPFALSSEVKLGSHVNSSTTFAPDRFVYSNYPGVLLDDTNTGYSFCMSGFPEQILTINSRGVVTVTEGTTICK